MWIENVRDADPLLQSEFGGRKHVLTLGVVTSPFDARFHSSNDAVSRRQTVGRGPYKERANFNRPLNFFLDLIIALFPFICSVKRRHVLKSYVNTSMDSYFLCWGTMVFGILTSECSLYFSIVIWVLWTKKSVFPLGLFTYIVE